MWPNFDLKTVMTVLDAIKKQLELNLVVKTATSIYTAKIGTDQVSDVNECCMKAKEILNTSKTIVGA